MRFETVFVLLCFFLCGCNGAPGGEVNKKEVLRHKYTDEEKKFVIEEVLSLLDNHKAKNSASMWNKVAEKHREKRRQKVNGFPQDRSAESLRVHFREALKNYLSHNNGIMPEGLMQKLVELDEVKTKRGLSRIRSSSYTTEEEKVIFEEVLKPTCVKLFSSTTLRAIRDRLENNHQRKVHGFELERTIDSIRSHMRMLRDKDQFPSEIVSKFSLTHQGAITSDISSQDQPSDSQGTNYNGPRSKYTDEENDFVIGEILSLFDVRTSPNSKAMWDNVAKKHLEKWEQKATGFPQKRSANSLRVHFQEILKNYQSQKDIVLPKSLMEKLTAIDQEKIKRGLARMRYCAYSKAEEQVIFEELLKPSCVKFFGASSMQAIQEKLNENYQNNVYGFDHERTLSSIRLHLGAMRERNLFPSDIVKKFRLLQKDVSTSSNAPFASPDNFAGASSSYIPWQNEEINSELAAEGQDEDDAWIAEMVEELRDNTDVDIDFNVLELLCRK